MFSEQLVVCYIGKSILRRNPKKGLSHSRIALNSSSDTSRTSISISCRLSTKVRQWLCAHRGRCLWCRSLAQGLLCWLLAEPNSEGFRKEINGFQVFFPGKIGRRVAGHDQHLSQKVHPRAYT